VAPLSRRHGVRSEPGSSVKGKKKFWV